MNIKSKEKHCFAFFYLGKTTVNAMVAVTISTAKTYQADIP